jgi:hypothetical protein
MARSFESALLLIGAYGVGKTTVAAEVASLLEAAGEPYAAIDLDWLAWANVPAAAHDDPRLLARNLAQVVANDRAAGVRRFVLAGAVADHAALDAIRTAAGVPVTVVRITAPMALVEQRLEGDPTTGRADDLAAARAWLDAGVGEGLEDAVVENTGPLRAAAERVLAVAGWEPEALHRAPPPATAGSADGGDNDPRFVADAEVRANGGEILHRGPLRVDDPRWPAEAERLHRGIRIRDTADPDPKAWTVLVFPDGSVRISPRLARRFWFRASRREGERP